MQGLNRMFFPFGEILTWVCQWIPHLTEIECNGLNYWFYYFQPNSNRDFYRTLPFYGVEVSLPVSLMSLSLSQVHGGGPGHRDPAAAWGGAAGGVSGECGDGCGWCSGLLCVLQRACGCERWRPSTADAGSGAEPVRDHIILIIRP